MSGRSRQRRVIVDGQRHYSDETIEVASGCPHGARSTPSTCSQCLGFVVERVALRTVEEAVALGSIKAIVLDDPEASERTLRGYETRRARSHKAPGGNRGAAEVRAALRRQHAEDDVDLGAWVAERVVADSDGFLPTAIAFEDYVAWRAARGLPPVSETPRNIAHRISVLLGINTRNVFRDGERKTSWVGFRLATSSDDVTHGARGDLGTADCAHETGASSDLSAEVS